MKCHDQDFRFGIEHELAFQNSHGEFADFTNTRFEDFQKIIDALPSYASDAQQLRRGDAGIRLKRWYIEGYERFSEDGKLITCLPKGIEIRTTIQPTIADAINELQTSFNQLVTLANQAGYQVYPTSYNPVQTLFIPDPPLNAFEIAERSGDFPEEYETAHIPMLSYGPDLNISCLGLDSEALIDIACKLTAISPFIVPFSFADTPWHDAHLGEIQSIRTWHRTGARPAVLVFLPDPDHLLDTIPTLTKAPRHPAEAGRIEFKAFDACSDFSRYAALFALLKGLILDQTLTERATVPNTEQHRLAAVHGFKHLTIHQHAEKILYAAEYALTDPADRILLQSLFDLLEKSSHEPK